MDYSKYLATGVEIGKKAGEIIRTGFSMDVVPDWKADKSPITETDKAVNKYVIKTIEENYPDHGVLGEEQSNDYEEKEFVWVCDPIDGTLPFSHGLKTSTFTLALTYDGKPIVSVIVDPYNDLLYTAVLDEGAFLNGEKINVNDAKTIEKGAMEIRHTNKAVHDLEKAGASLTGHMSFVYGAKQVATGHYVAAVFSGDTPWDCAGVSLLIQEAGGKVTDLAGKDQRYDRKINGLIASNGFVHEEVLNMIKSNEQNL